MNNLYNPHNIDRFSESLIRAVENEDERNIEGLLFVLQVLVNGPPGERCQSFYNQRMPPDRCIAAVLRSKSTQDALRMDTRKCEQLINLVLGLPYLTGQLCRALSTLIACLSPSSDLKKNVASIILGHEDLYKFDLKTIRHCLEEDATELEMTMIKLCGLDVRDEDFFKLFDHWIRWCSQSSDVFQAVSGIWNELLRRMKCKRSVLDAVTRFVREVRKTCDINGIDPITLYPYDAQRLVFLLEIDFVPLNMEGGGDFGAVLTEIRQEFGRMRETDPYTALVLSTHFPQWNEFLD